ncbi:MAG: lysine--tRNA ligase [Candidatus Micrarchaeia archaeon]
MQEIKEDKISEHWVSVLVKEILSSTKPPFVVASGITTSGPTHIGTASEFIYPNAIVTYFKNNGYDVQFIFIGDIMDAFDSIPKPLEQFKDVLEPHLGKPLVHVPDPFGCHASYGDHFLSEAADLMKRFKVNPEIVRNSDLYAKGLYDKYAIKYLNEREKVRDVVFESSLRKKEGKEWENWSPIAPICEKCGKISTCTVTGFDGEYYYYKCNKDVEYTKGCGHEGKARISDHQYKLVWRVEWPSRQDFLNVTIEGFGKDHATRGGSADTAREMHEKILGRKPPFFYRFGFFLLGGKKYSKSKGIGLDVNTVLKLMPPEVIKYFIYRSDSQEDKNFDPTGQNMLLIFEDYEYASTLSQPKETLSRADRKKRIAYEISGERKWKAKFLDILLYYQIYRDWERVKSLFDDPEGVEYLKPYIVYWIDNGYVPEDYSFSINPKKPLDIRGIKEFAERLDDKMDQLAIHNLVFDTAKSLGIEPKDFFKTLYTALIGKDRGPKLGKLIHAIGPGKVKKMLIELVS